MTNLETLLAKHSNNVVVTEYEDTVTIVYRKMDRFITATAHNVEDAAESLIQKLS